MDDRLAAFIADPAAMDPQTLVRIETTLAEDATLAAHMARQLRMHAALSCLADPRGEALLARLVARRAAEAARRGPSPGMPPTSRRRPNDAAPRSRRCAPRMAMGVTLAALAIIVISFALHRASPPGSPHALDDQGRRILSGADVERGEGSDLRLAFPDGSRIHGKGPLRLGADAIAATGASLRLHHGRITAAIAPQRDAAFAIATP